MKYLLDINICIHFLRDKFNIQEIIRKIGHKYCSISEMTVFELYFGAEKSSDPEKSSEGVAAFNYGLKMIAIYSFVKLYAKEKVRFQKIGKALDEEFDLLTGVTAKHNKLTLITENFKYFQNFENLQLENWIQR